MDKKLNIALSLLILTTVVLFSLNFVMAQTLVSPASGTNWTGTMAINCTFGAVPAPLNTTFFYNASGGSTRGATTLATIINDSDLDPEAFTAQQSISSASNAAIYNFSCFVSNATTAAHSIGDRSGITIDNTSPTCTSTLSRTGQIDISNTRTNTATCTCTDGIDSAPVVSRALTIPREFISTPSASPYTIGINNFTINQLHTWGCYGVDYTNNNASAGNRTFKVIDEDGGGGTESITGQVVEEEDTSDSDFLSLFFIISSGVIVIAAFGYGAVKYSRRRRR